MLKPSKQFLARVLNYIQAGHITFDVQTMPDVPPMEVVVSLGVALMDGTSSHHTFKVGARPIPGAQQIFTIFEDAPERRDVANRPPDADLHRAIQQLKGE